MDHFPVERLQALIDRREYNALVQELESLELELTLACNAAAMTNVYAPLLAGYILCNDLDSARFLRKRILARNSSTYGLDSLWTVCVILRERRFYELYSAIDHVDESPDWSSLLKPLIKSLSAAIKVTVREQILGLVAKAYECIKMADAIKYFGMSDDNLLQELASEGWKYCPTNNAFYPPIAGHRNPTNLGQFERLADIVVRLEEF